jgi:hypothetical protein
MSQDRLWREQETSACEMRTKCTLSLVQTAKVVVTAGH